MAGKSVVMAGGLVLAAAAGAYFMLGVDFGPHEEYAEISTLATVDSLPAPPSAYGIPLAGFHVVRQQVKPGSTLSEMLLPKGISAAMIDSLVGMAEPVFNINRIKAGHTVAFVYPDDTSAGPSYFVYETDPVEHVVFDLRGPFAVHIEKLPVHYDERSLSVEVTGALWNDLVDADAPPALAAELSNVFAWTVDFYRIQKGDRFTMVYSQGTVQGRDYGTPQLLGVRYEGSDIQEAFFYHGDSSKEGYYDAEGNSLRKAFLKAPLKYSRISSGYTLRRFHPVQKRWKSHLGTDYAAPYGTPIHATADGVVTRASYSGGNGRYVKIRHNSVYQTQYLHMRKILVKQGQVVKQGDVIGEVGSTGLATGPHVCYRFWKNGKQVDPRKEKLPSAEPLPAAELPAFNKVRDVLAQRLDQEEAEAKHINVAAF